MAIFASWKIRTARLMNRSSQLVALDATVTTVARSGPGAGDVNILACYQAFLDWKGAKPAEFNVIKSAADELEADLRGLYRHAKLPIAGIKSSGVRPVGWNLVAFHPVTHSFTTALPPHNQIGALSPIQIQRVNESFRRVKNAVTRARDAMITVAKRQQFSRPMPIEEQLYTDYFGAYDKDRVVKVRQNFQVLYLAFDSTPNMVDLRDTRYGLTCYAACYRANHRVVDTKGSVSLGGKVNLFLGRAFLGKGDYVNTTDATVGTLVHEFAHGACNAVDVPPVNNLGNFTHARKSDDAGHNDFGASTDNNIQASTDSADKLLAKHKPAYAVVNADCYGQFAKQILLARSG